MLSFKKRDKSKLMNLIIDEKNKVVETIFLNEKYNYDLKQDQDFLKKIDKYTENKVIDEKSGIVTEFEMKKGYRLEPTPDYFNELNERIIKYIVGKSGSGKSWYTASFVKKYHHMFPDNKIYYVSVNRIENDRSYDMLMKKKSFKKVFNEIELETINSVIDFSNYRNCIFIFDDVIDIEISLDPDKMAKEYILEKENKKKSNAGTVSLGNNQVNINNQNNRNSSFGRTTNSHSDASLTIAEKGQIAKFIACRAKLIKKNIVDSIICLLNAGRKNSISVLITDHKLFSGPVSSKVQSESHNIVLFPYGNVSSAKLHEFLTKKLSFDNQQADKVVETEYKKFEFLNINVSGCNFYNTGKIFKFL